MTIDKAGRVLNDYRMQSAFEATPEFVEAIKMGIAALRAVEIARHGFINDNFHKLPGETKD